MSDDMNLNVYQCEEAILRLYDYLDRELSPADQTAIEQHLGICEHCLRRFDFDARLLQTIRQKCRNTRAPEAVRRRIGRLLDEF